jgi:sugar phosphate isomerase/epimerase
MTRRELMTMGASAALASNVQASDPRFGPVMTFAKHLQWLSFDKVAVFLEENDLDGIEATVRKGGQVEPENVERDLPRLVEALEKRGRKVVMITTDVNDAENPLSQRVIKTADSLGIKWFRMAYYRYDLERPILAQLEEYHQTAMRLADYLGGFQIMGLYQNHASRNLVGGPIWDLHRLLEGIPADRVAAVYDLRHATVEGGLSWPLTWRVIRDRVRLIYMKDFRWEGRKAVNVPLGTGQVDPALYEMVSTEVSEGTPVSLHMEYIDHRDPAKQRECMEAITRDRQALRKLTGA